MFTGIITDKGLIKSRVERGDFITFEIASTYDVTSIDLGASIACSGVCLTVTHMAERPEGGCIFSVDVSPETMEKTTSEIWDVGTVLNLERAMKAGDEFGGHIVSGHVDQVTEILDRKDNDGGSWFKVAMPENLKPYIADKGSICLDGTSLTVNKVGEDYFEIMLIPHSLDVTTWGELKIGQRINLEIDTFARYVARYVDTALAAKGIVK